MNHKAPSAHLCMLMPSANSIQARLRLHAYSATCHTCDSKPSHDDQPVHVDVLGQPHPRVVMRACLASPMPQCHKRTRHAYTPHPSKHTPVHVDVFRQPHPGVVVFACLLTQPHVTMPHAQTAILHQPSKPSGNPPVHVDVLCQPHPGVVAQPRRCRVVLLAHRHLHLAHQQPDGRQRLGRGLAGGALLGRAAAAAASAATARKAE